MAPIFSARFLTLGALIRCVVCTLISLVTRVKQHLEDNPNMRPTGDAHLLKEINYAAEVRIYVPYIETDERKACFFANVAGASLGYVTHVCAQGVSYTNIPYPTYVSRHIME